MNKTIVYYLFVFFVATTSLFTYSCVEFPDYPESFMSSTPLIRESGSDTIRDIFKRNCVVGDTTVCVMEGQTTAVGRLISQTADFEIGVNLESLYISRGHHLVLDAVSVDHVMPWYDIESQIEGTNITTDYVLDTHTPLDFSSYLESELTITSVYYDYAEMGIGTEISIYDDDGRLLLAAREELSGSEPVELKMDEQDAVVSCKRGASYATETGWAGRHRAYRIKCTAMGKNHPLEWGESFRFDFNGQTYEVVGYISESLKAKSNVADASGWGTHFAVINTSLLD